MDRQKARDISDMFMNALAVAMGLFTIYMAFMVAGPLWARIMFGILGLLLLGCAIMMVRNEIVYRIAIKAINRAYTWYGPGSDSHKTMMLEINHWTHDRMMYAWRYWTFDQFFPYWPGRER